VNFSGYVQLRRGLLEHLQDGRLSLLEYAVLVALILLASKESGSGTINANTLGSFMGDGLDYESEVPRNRQRGKQRILRSLEVKHYIFRNIVPRSKRAYRYWIDKYVCTDGPNKSRRLDLSQVFTTKDVSCIRYVGAVAEGVAEPVAETVASNKKGEKRLETKPSTETSASLKDSVINTKSESEHSTKRSSKSEACALHGAHHGVHHDVHHVNDTQLPILVTGEDPYYKDPRTGARLAWDAAQRLLAEASMQKRAN
jgi:hypothetical protein